MASLYNRNASKPFLFESKTAFSKGLDSVATLQRDMANEKQVAYNTRPLSIVPGSTTGFANKNRLLFNRRMGNPGEMVVKETRLLYPRMTQDYVNARLDPEHRPFATVPYMGKGRKNVEKEFHILRGARNPNDEELSIMKRRAEESTAAHSFLPPGKLVRDVPQMPSEWIRGGEPTVKRGPR